MSDVTQSQIPNRTYIETLVVALGGNAIQSRGDRGTAQEQFAVSDERSPAEVAAMLEAAGYEPVWKDAFPLVDSTR